MRKLKNEELGRLTVEEFKKEQKQHVSVFLDNVRSMHNIGSAFRTADAFLIERIYLTGISAKPPHREINKTALGATESVDWEYHENSIDLAKKLRNEGRKLIAVEQTENCTLLNNFFPKRDTNYTVIFGNEVYGIQQEIVNEADEVIQIPQAGTKHSLNISVAVGIVMWHFFNCLKTH